MLLFVIVQPQGVGQGVDHGGAGVGFLAALDADVVVDAHPGQRGQFFPAQPRRTPDTPAYPQARLLRGEPDPAGAQESPEFGATVAGSLLTCHVISVAVRLPLIYELG